MGQTFAKCCKKDESSDSSSVYELPAVAIDEAKEKEGGKKKKKRNKFLRWIKGRRDPSATETPPVTADRSGDGRHVTEESEASTAVLDSGVPASPDRSVSHSGDDVVQSPVHSAGQVDGDNHDPPRSFSRESDWEQEVEQTPVNHPEEKLEYEMKANGSIEEINSCLYEIGNELGQGGFGTVYEGTRLSDGLKVALKYVVKDENTDYVSIPDYDEPIPREVALLTLVCKGNAREIIQLLDWQDLEKNYIMVLERFTPCGDLARFLCDAGGQIDEKTARVIMKQAAKTAYMCCKRKVFHRDIKLENFLINTDTLEIKLIDFGCGDFLKTSAYTECVGTEEYFGPEFLEEGKYYAKSTTVYSLGVLLFTLLCGRFPDTNDKYQMKNKIWSVHGISKECLNLVEACMKENLKERIPLRAICGHVWFQSKHLTDQQQKITDSPAEDDVDRLSEGEILLPTACVSQSEDKKYNWIEEINSCQYGIGEMLGQGGFGYVYEGTRLTDGLKVAMKYLDKEKNTDYVSIPGYDEPIPREVALLTLANEGDAVPEIIRLLDWQECEKDCIIVLERFTPCEDVGSFIKRHGGCIDEALARVILRQVTEAAEVCRRRGVFHRDIKPNNLLVDPDTVKVKLIDFGCGDLLKTSTYRNYIGTARYACPEFAEKGEYKANPATVYSLGVLLFIMVCGVFPTHNDLYQMNEKVWCEDGLTTECCSLIQSCLQENPEERLLLENVLEHVWFQEVKMEKLKEQHDSEMELLQEELSNLRCVVSEGREETTRHVQEFNDRLQEQKQMISSQNKQVYKTGSESVDTYDQHYGRGLGKETVREGLSKFFYNGNVLRKDANTGSILKVQKILEWFEGQSQLSFYASSLLFVYEGGCSPGVVRSDRCLTPKACEQNNNIGQNLSPMFSLHKKACVRTHYQAKQDNAVWTTTQQPNGNRGRREEGEELQRDAEQDTGGDVEVKMIDFAHVFPSDGHDQGYIYGLKNPLKVLRQILEE